MSNYYDILGVESSATEAEIKRAFRKRAGELHPDKNPDDPTAESRFKELNEAYQVLSDPAKRAGYDNPGGWGRSTTYHNININDLFNDFFGQGNFTRSNYPRPQRGDDVETVIKISLLESLQGVDKEIDIRTPCACDDCAGRGDRSDKGPITCPQCGGRGVVQARRGIVTMTHDCPQCRGGGRIPREPCGSCNSTGVINRMRHLRITVPAGVRHGDRIRLSGQGGPGKLGGNAGDIYVNVRVQADHRFARSGLDLHSSINIPYTKCVLGGEIEIERLDGSRHKTVLAPGTEPGSQVVIPSEGFPSINGSGEVGRHLVQVNLQMPRNVTPRMKEALHILEEENSVS